MGMEHCRSRYGLDIYVGAIKRHPAVEVVGSSPVTSIKIYKEMFINCDWSILAQLIPNKSAKICNNRTRRTTRVIEIKKLQIGKFCLLDTYL